MASQFTWQAALALGYRAIGLLFPFSFLLYSRNPWTCHAKGSARGTTESERTTNNFWRAEDETLWRWHAIIRVAERWFEEAGHFWVWRGRLMIKETDRIFKVNLDGRVCNMSIFALCK
jgi:hypothetical protein